MSHLLWIIVIRPVNRASNQTKVKKGISKREENQECYEAKADHFPKISGQCPPCYSDSDEPFIKRRSLFSLLLKCEWDCITALTIL